MNTFTGDLGHAQTVTLLALVKVYDRDGRATIRDVAKESGVSSWRRTHERLHALRDLGLVSFEDGRTGTLRPLVAPVAFGGES